jgi:crotonobetainyl-CoA:carnitine CoA-transferase CaiB-like acyl-CoA transferase
MDRYRPDAAVSDIDRRVLEGLLLVDLSCGIGGAYTAKLLTDAGATAVRVEPLEGAALRGRRESGDAPLFGYLDGGKRSVVLDDGDEQTRAGVERLLAAAHVIVTDSGDGHSLGHRYPTAIVVSHTAFGLDGPWRDRPACDLTVQALSGSIGGRGEIDHPPIAAGGDLAAWIGGVAAAAAVLMAWRAGAGTVIDIAELETAVTIYNGFQTVAYELTGVASPTPARVSEIPSIERAADGWVGFCALSAQQFAAFADMIGRPEWAADPQVSRIDWRSRNAATLRPEIEEWTANHTVDEIVALAAARRLPCAPVGNGATLPTVDQLVTRGCFEHDGTASFRQPRPPARLSRVATRAATPAAAVGSSDADEILAGAGASARITVGSWPLPLAGVRVFDMTSFWAGPAASQILAAFGADVIKVESIQRPDGTRLGTSYGVTGERAWERAPLYHGCNTGKRGITLDLTRPEGQDLARRLLERCDVLIENYTPRVAERFGLLDTDRGGSTDRGAISRVSPRPWSRSPASAG